MFKVMGEGGAQTVMFKVMGGGCEASTMFNVGKRERSVIHFQGDGRDEGRQPCSR